MALASPRPAPRGTWTLAVPGWQPARLNELLAGRWAAHKLKRRDRRVIAQAALAESTPKAAGKRRVALTITLAPRQRGADPDAYQKSLGDALVHAGLLVDDNRQGVEWAPVAYARGPAKAATITLTDL